MMEKIKNHFDRWNPKRFVLVAIMTLIILDILNTIYLKLYWLGKGLSPMLVHQAIRKNGNLPEDFSPDTILEMIGFLNNTFYFFLLLVLVNNFFFYFFYWRKKLWAQGYVLFYALTAAIFALTFIIDDVKLGWMWFLYNILTIPVYLYIYFGVKVLKDVTTVIPGYEKKEQ